MKTKAIVLESARLVETKYGKKYPVKIDEDGNEKTIWLNANDEVAPHIKANHELEITYQAKGAPIVKILGRVEKQNYNLDEMTKDVASLGKAWIDIYKGLAGNLPDIPAEHLISGVNTIFITLSKKH